MKLSFHAVSVGFVLGCLLLCFVTVRSFPIVAQSGQPLAGTVSTTNGHPIEGATVYGSQSKTCCPFKRESTKTDSSGQFTLHSPGAVIHVVAEKFQPKVLVVQPSESQTSIILESDSDSIVLPICKRPASGVRRIAGGFIGLRFDVRKKDFEVLGGKPDVDYVRCAIKPKASKSFVNLWFGPYAFNADPDDDLVLDSVSITEHTIKTNDGKMAGIDSFGQLRNGERWRHFWVAAADGAEYRASAPDSVLLDQVVDSACQTGANSRHLT